MGDFGKSLHQEDARDLEEVARSSTGFGASKGLETPKISNGT